MKIRLVFLASVVLALTPVATAQQPPAPESLLDRLPGHWVLTGKIAGKETVHDVDAEWVLRRGYIRLHEVSHEKNAAGSPAYEAIVFIGWDKDASQFSCLWLDSTAGGGLSAQGIGHAKPKPDELAILFKDSSGNMFHNTFKYDRVSDTWRWIMDNDEDGKLKPFGRVVLRKKPDR